MSKVPGRSITEVSGSRRIIREYDSDGSLLRIRIEPLSFGATSDLPPIEKRQRPPKAVKTVAPPPAPPVVAPAPKPTPQLDRAPTAAEPEVERLPVTLLPYEEPAVAPASEELPVTVVPYSEPVAAEPAPIPQAPVPLAFTILSEEIVTPPTPEAAPTPRPLLSPRLDSEADASETTPPAPPPEPVVEAPAPPPAPEPEIVAQPEPKREPEPDPEPQPWVAYIDRVPDVDDRVDSILAEHTRNTKNKKRAPIPVPAFEPTRREAWEERLDKALASKH